MLHTTAWVSYEASLCLLELDFTQSVGQFVNWTSGLFLRGLPKIKLGRLYESHILLCLVLFNWHALAQYAICFIRLIYLTHLLLCVLQIKLFKMSLNWVVEAFPRNWTLEKKKEKKLSSFDLKHHFILNEKKNYLVYLQNKNVKGL